jgi:hypothetical protein
LGIKSNKLDLTQSKENHFQQHPPVLPALDIGCSLDPFAVTDGKNRNFQTELFRTEQRAKTPEGSHRGNPPRDALSILKTLENQISQKTSPRAL